MLIKYQTTLPSPEGTHWRRGLDIWGDSLSYLVAFYATQREMVKESKGPRGEKERDHKVIIHRQLCPWHSARVSSAHWTVLLKKKKPTGDFSCSPLHLFHSISTFSLLSTHPSLHPLFTLSAPFMSPFILSSSHSTPFWLHPLLVPLLYTPSLLYVYVLSIFFPKVEVRLRWHYLLVCLERGGAKRRRTRELNTRPCYVQRNDFSKQQLQNIMFGL